MIKREKNKETINKNNHLESEPQACPVSLRTFRQVQGCFIFIVANFEILIWIHLKTNKTPSRWKAKEEERDRDKIYKKYSLFPWTLFALNPNSQTYRASEWVCLVDLSGYVVAVDYSKSSESSSSFSSDCLEKSDIDLLPVFLELEAMLVSPSAPA